MDFALSETLTTSTSTLICLSLSSRHTSPFLFPFYFFRQFAAFNFYSQSRPQPPLHLPLRRPSIHLCLSSGSCPHFPIFASQIHRAASAPRLSAQSRACRSTCLCHSAPNPHALPCRPSKTGECYSVTAPTERHHMMVLKVCAPFDLFLLSNETGAAAVITVQLCACMPNFPFHIQFPV